ncbi:putative bifunctional diguanylate cyclase/phosphodiesterase [Arthrobacter oryzae]|uniref:putative bifunctional diguanylate cyclase/phosphodiesterase n=1 Tax=Arthrobacter oryzae TaxID=409290 RepID=UPI002784ACCA|nr:EAL domain-containing protein [Arthrobacter oryzae]MDQ0077798.1 diguanylate cyclase (GGDEF)-like protein [Arthrobacter oryzae]
MDGNVPGKASGPVSTAADTGMEGAGRTWSLQREWSRAFLLMLAALLIGAAVTIVGVRGLMDQVQATSAELHLRLDKVEVLRSALDAHEQLGHQMLSNAPGDRSAFLRQQEEISRLFQETAAILPGETGMRDTIATARQSWQEALTAHGLWGGQVQSLQGNHVDESPALAAASAEVRKRVAEIRHYSLLEMDKGLAHNAELEQLLIIGRIALFVVAVGVTVYFRRRMVKDLMRPVESLHKGVQKLRGGNYNHRIEVFRRDELGELAEAFNGMAAAVHNSHLNLTHRATHDPLTRLANRAALMERLTESFGRGSTRRNRSEGLLFIDIDDFKDVNDSLGHERGDDLLVQLAARLQGCVRTHDLVARVGGDEFAIVVMDDDAGSVTAGVAERIHEALRTPFFLGEDRRTVTASMGAAQRRPGTSDAAELLRQADFAMYLAKHGGKARYQLFDAEGYDHMTYRAALKRDLATAVSGGQLRLEYQPIADLNSGEILGVEALVRWQHPTLGLLAPSEFIPLAEETGDIDAVGCWVLDTASRQAAGWRKSLPRCENVWIAINLSTIQLPNPRNLAAIKGILSDPAAQADKVVLEVTETALAGSTDGGVAALKTLKGTGVRVAIDDFGTGYSSLSSLAVLPADILKIDRSFLGRQASEAQSAAMLEGILGLARMLSLEVIAEGVEEPGQLDLLRALDCRMGQGYLLARPGSAEAIKALLASGARLQPGPAALEEAVDS